MEDKWELRPYQKECKEILDKTPTGNHLVVMATGLGKTVVLTHLKRNGRVLLLSHRDELVRQPEKYFDCSFGIEKAGEHATDEEVVSASVQSLSRPGRMERFAPDAFDTIIIDEAHHSAAKSYRQILDYFSGANRRIGFTATPQRGDKVRLTDVFDDIIFNRDLRWGIENNYLSRIRCERVRGKFKLKSVKKKLGDYSENDLARTLESTETVPVAAKAYMKKCRDRHTIIYCVNKRFCYLLKDVIVSMLPEKEKDSVCVITGDTDPEERRQMLADFSVGKIRCIINCMILTEGTDLPICDTIMSVRPTCNPTLYQQMAGRGTRLYEGKEYCLLIDIVPADDDTVPDLCTAPTLFGVDPALLDKEQRKQIKPDVDLLSLCDSLRGVFTSQAERLEIETRKIDLFLDSCNEALEQCKGKPITQLAALYNEKRQDLDYDFGGLDVEVCPDDEKHYKITPSWNDVIYISKPDVLDNVNMEFQIYTGRKEPSIVSGTIKMDKAVELARAYCELQPSMYCYSWDKEAQRSWSQAVATDKQESRIMREYARRGIRMEGIKTLNRLEASRLVDLSRRMKEAEARKKVFDSAASGKKGAAVKDSLMTEFKAEDAARAIGKKQFSEFCNKTLNEKKRREERTQELFSILIPGDGEVKPFAVSAEFLSSARKPASTKQIGFISSLFEKSKDYAVFSGLSLRGLTMRQASLLIELSKKVTGVFGSMDLASHGIVLEFCNIPELLKAAENNGSGKFVFEYRCLSRDM